MKFHLLLDRAFDDFELGFSSSFFPSWSNLLSLKRAVEPKKFILIKILY